MTRFVTFIELTVSSPTPAVTQFICCENTASHAAQAGLLVMLASNGALVDSSLPVMGAAPVFTLNPLGPIGVVIADMAVNVQVSG